MMRLARTWRNSIPRNSPRPGSRSKIDSSNNAGGAPGSSASGHRSCDSVMPPRIDEQVFDAKPSPTRGSNEGYDPSWHPAFAAVGREQAVLRQQALGDDGGVVLDHA